MELTAVEQAFFLRVALHMENGLDIEAAGRAVLADDQRIAEVVLESDAHMAIHTSLGPKTMTTSRGRRGAEVRSEISRRVYNRLRAN